MKNTNEKKAKFFAQYWGQNVLKVSRIENAIQRFVTARVGSDTAWNSWVNKGHLELTPLSQITDEDAYGVGILVNCWSNSERRMDFFEDDDMKETHIAAGKLFAAAVGKEWGPGMSHPFANNSTDILNAYDFLRSKGYSLPWMGISVLQQIKFGWVKLDVHG